MRLKFMVFSIFLLSFSFGQAKCIDQSKDLDSCLQCCTDTAKTAQAIQNNPMIAQDLYSACGSSQGGQSAALSPDKAQDVYRKYRIEMSAIATYCASSAKTGAVLEAYNECVQTCKDRFAKRKPKK